MKRFIHSMLCWCAVAFIGMSVMSGCSQSRKYRIGISQCSTDDWRSKMNEEILREVILLDSVEVEIRSADDDNARQIADLDYFMENGFDLIAVAPNEAEALTPAIKRIYESGKPVIVFDRSINGDYYTAYQGADNEGIGRMAAAVAGSLANVPAILEIRGLSGSSPAEQRHSGFRLGTDSLGYRIVAEGYGNWNFETARRVTDSLLALNPEVNIIFAHNDRMALAAREAAISLGRPDIRIIGIDAAPEIGIKAVSEGKIDATFLYPTAGHELMRTALAILERRPYDKFLLLPTPSPVNASNAEILLLQDKALREETGKISELQHWGLSFSRRYDKQSYILYVAGVILLLAGVLIFVLLRFHWSSKRHHREMAARNDELSRQRDELDRLYRQLQEATGSKLTFFTNVSHDLRTPLTLIADPVNSLAEADNLTPGQRTLIQLASKNVKRLQRLINQILDIRKYDSGQLKLHPVNVDLARALSEWTTPFARIAAKRHIHLHTDFPQKPEIIIAIDVEKTERILFNLLSNAFKFTPENGTISVALRREGEDAVITVADTGIGIPACELNNVFERFFKTDTINPNGSGIGMALSKVFIDMHGGSISVESTQGAGTTFTVRLPIRQVDSSPESPTPSFLPEMEEIAEIEDEGIGEADVTEETPTVLVIDDNRDICILVRSVLADRYAVLTARSGAQGIRLANKYVPDLIICDVMMPGMSGFEVCAALKHDPLTSHIPVLILTACSRDEQRMEGYESGADGFMTKPFDSAMLLARCASLITNRRLIYQNMEVPVTVPPRRPDSTRTTTHEVEDEFLRRFITLVEAQLADSDLSVESLAGRLGISRVQMYRKVKALTNYSVVELIRNIRLKHASVMLKSTDATVSEVAYSVGFSSPGYFSRCYKEYFGESPVDTQHRTSRAR